MSRRIVGGLVGAAALVACLQLPFGAAGATSVTSPQGSLTAVSASAANNAWAVGCRPATFQCPGIGVDVAYHWTGSAWNQVSVPMPVPPNPADTESGQLTGVKVISSTNAWAVGTADPTGAQIAHWDGTSWKQVHVPSVPSPATLNGVAASSASDVWAVGSAGNGSLILHFNGKSWSQVKSPSPGTTTLYGVAAASTSNAWAVGTENGSCACNKALILHWNGAAWKVAYDALASSQTFLTSVSASSATNIWAGGITRATVNSALMMQWNGASWKRVTTGAGTFSSNGATNVFGMATTSTKNVWAVGSYGGSSRILHWDGTAWKSSSLPALPGSSSSLTAATATGTTNAWAVGSYNDSAGIAHVTILRWNGTAWTRVG